LAIGAVVFMITFSAGAAINISKKEAEDLKGQLTKQIIGIDQNGIFINNIKVALGMFIPAVGIAIGISSGFSTGIVFSAMAKTSPILNNIPPLIILFTPFGIMEVFAYGLAMSRSGLLIYQLVKKKSFHDFFFYVKTKNLYAIVSLTIPTIVEVGIVAVILFVGAIIEWDLIQQFGRFNNRLTM
jgi:hypothetical protein